MKREEHLKFCKKCQNRKFDINQGIICGITMKKADFEDSCEDFIIDESVSDTKKLNKDKDIKSKKAMRLVLIVSLLVIALIIGFVFTKSTIRKKNWEKARQENTILSYENFISKYPNSKFIDLANSSLEKLYWQEAITLDSIPIYENFISKYPNSRNNTLAIEKLEVKMDEIFYSRCKRVDKFRSNSHSGYMAVDNEGSGSALQNWLNDAMGVTLIISGGGSIHGHLVEKEYGVVLFSDYGKIYAHNINDEEGVWGRACECDIKLLEQLYIEIKNNSYKNQIIRELKNIGTERALRTLKRIKEKQE